MFDKILSRAKQAEQTFMVTLAVAIGCLGGAGAVLFRKLIAAVQDLSWGSGPYSVSQVSDHPAWYIVLIPALGGLIVGPMVYYLAREAKGHGVPEVMEAVALRSGVMRPRLVIVKTLASAISIGTGGSVGREGPIVQIGSALGSTLGQWFRLSGARLRTMVGCGAAAGIAATFNAPLAGALFSVEIILGDFAVTQFSPIVISSVVATVIARHYLGDVAGFVVPEYSLHSVWELGIYALLGIVAALVALVFVRVLYGAEDLAERLPLPGWFLAALGGAAVGAIGIGYPQVFGVGYEAIEGALRGETAIALLGLLLVLKIVATSITIGSGGSGGVFAPSLFIGAMTGGALGTACQRWLPTIVESPGAYALVGMGAVVAAATNAPITAILIIFELTSDYKLIVPLMAACIISTLVATRFSRDSIYTLKLRRRGVNIRKGQDVNVLRALRVRDVMSSGFATVEAGISVGELIERVADQPSPRIYVIDDEGSFVGTIALPELRRTLLKGSASDTPTTENLTSGDLAREDPRTLYPTQSLDAVMRIFGGKSREELPVTEDGKLVGVVSRQHLLDAYNDEILKRDMVSEISSSVSAASSTDEVILSQHHRMAEIDAPGLFIGRSIRDLEVRARHGAQILVIRRPHGPGTDQALDVIPEPSTIIERGDRLVLVADEPALRRLRAL